MLRILAVSEQNQICGRIMAAGDYAVDYASGPAEAIDTMDDALYAAVVLCPLGDAREYIDAAIYACAASGVIFVADDGLLGSLADSFRGRNILLLSADAHPAVFGQALSFVSATHANVERLSARNKKLVGKLDEVQLVFRAKGALMHNLNMTEPQAHRYIEKQAMDLRVTRAEVARSILTHYAPPGQSRE